MEGGVRQGLLIEGDKVSMGDIGIKISLIKLLAPSNIQTLAGLSKGVVTLGLQSLNTVR